MYTDNNQRCNDTKKAEPNSAGFVILLFSDFAIDYFIPLALLTLVCVFFYGKSSLILHV